MRKRSRRGEQERNYRKEGRWIREQGENYGKRSRFRDSRGEVDRKGI